jgi:hypothetical protein
VIFITADSAGITSAAGGNGGASAVTAGLGGAGGVISVAAPGNLSFSGGLNTAGGVAGDQSSQATSGAIVLTAGGAITQGLAITTASLTATGASVTLDLGNTVGTLTGTATAGDFLFNNTTTVNIGGVTATGLASITSGGDILGGLVQGSAVFLSAAGAIGAPLAHLSVGAATLDASAANGISLEINGLAPQPVMINTLSNSATGDIFVNAYGGATTTSLVSNPGGSVMINTFSPLVIQAGIDAAGSILLSTKGVLGTIVPHEKDMTLSGPFTYGSLGVFEVIIGPGGELHLVQSGLNLTAELFPNPLQVTKFTFFNDPLANATVLQSVSTTIVTTVNTATESDKQEEGEDKQKRTLGSCRAS